MICIKIEVGIIFHIYTHNYKFSDDFTVVGDTADGFPRSGKDFSTE